MMTIVLPIATVQPDFEAIISDVQEGLVPEDSFWFSSYKTGEPSVHGKVRLTLDEVDRNLVRYEGEGGVQFQHKGERKFVGSCQALNLQPTKFALPKKVFSDPLPQAQKTPTVYRRIQAFDVAPDGSQFAAGYEDGSVVIVPTSPSDPSIYTTSKPHLNAITSLNFFPSSKVILTSSVDFSLSIIPAEHPASASQSPIKVSPARTFKGHTRAVTSTGIISRGRTILSSSKDGTIRIWDVPSGSQIRSMGVKGYTPILAMATGEKGEGAYARPPDGEDKGIPVPQDAREVETEDKVVFCATYDGSIQAFDLGSKLSVFRTDPARGSPALQSIAYSPSSNLLATGSVKGVVTVYDTRSLSNALVSFTRNSASIEDLKFVAPINDSAQAGLAIATEDGLPYIAGVRPEGPFVEAELVGTDCEAVRCVRVRADSGDVWTAGDDGVVRQYDRLV